MLKSLLRFLDSFIDVSNFVILDSSKAPYATVPKKHVLKSSNTLQK